MQCPRCKTNDVYISRSGNKHIFNFLMVTVRCHRCCYLFSVPRWSSVPEKPESTVSPHNRETPQRRAA
jgi:hypothetical protein